MNSIKYGEPISVIIKDRGYHQVAVRYLNERVVARLVDGQWVTGIDTAALPRSLLCGLDGILDITAYDNGDPIAMGSIKVELGGARLELEPLPAPTMSINPPTRL